MAFSITVYYFLATIFAICVKLFKEKLHFFLTNILFLYRYPERHIGVIDDVCMRHSQGAGESKGDNNLYSVPAPYDEREEESRRVAEYGYYPSRVEAMGYNYRTITARGQVERSVSGPSDDVLDEKNGLGPSSSSNSRVSAFNWLRGAHGDAEKNEERVGSRFSKKDFIAYIGVAVVATFGAVSLLAVRKQRRGRHAGQRRSSPKHTMTGLV